MSISEPEASKGHSEPRGDTADVTALAASETRDRGPEVQMTQATQDETNHDEAQGQQQFQEALERILEAN